MMDIQTNRVDDLAILLTVLKTSEVAQGIDTHFKPHIRWSGPSPGTLTMVWLAYLLSESDHRLSVLEDWAENHLHVLRWLLEIPDLKASHFSDDRLGLLLEYFSDGEKWAAFESTHNQNLLRVYDLDQRLVRLDASVAQSFRQAEDLFRFGHSKHHRSDLPQLKMMLATLDPLSMPLACYTVEGHRADDQLYIPVIEQVQAQFSTSAMLYVGDTKLGSHTNRSYLARSQNRYLCPLSRTQFSVELLSQAIDQVGLDDSGRQAVFKSADPEQAQEQIAWAYECPSALMYDAQHDFQWTERRILVHSLNLARTKTDALMERLIEVQQIIQERFNPRQGRKVFRDMEQARAFVNKHLQRRKVQGLIQVELKQGAPSLKIKKPAPVECGVHIDLEAVKAQTKLFGWRIYATNESAQGLPPAKLVRCYRQQYRIEQQFNRLLNRTTALQPIFLNLEHRIQALIRVLILALKYVSIIQHKVRTKMAKTNQSLEGIIPGNPGRKVKRPTTERLLKAFHNIFLNIVHLDNGPPLYQITKLNQTQKQILDLLDLPYSIYLHHCQRT